jgi:hypothetical protein
MGIAMALRCFMIKHSITAPSKRGVAAGSAERKNTMKNKGLALQSVPGMKERRARQCQLAGYRQSSRARNGIRVRQVNWRIMLSRSCLGLVLWLGLPAMLCAQKQQGQWSDLRGLTVGQTVVVIESSMKRHSGEFVSVTDEALTLKEKGPDISLKREEVVRVSTSSGARRGEHAAIGLLIGAAAGAGIGATAGSGSKNWIGLTEGVGALVGIAIGATSGAIVGVTIPAHRTIYRTAPAASSP